MVMYLEKACIKPKSCECLLFYQMHTSIHVSIREHGLVTNWAERVECVFPCHHMRSHQATGQ